MAILLNRFKSKFVERETFMTTTAIRSREKFKLSDNDIKMLEQDRDEHLKCKSESYSRKEAKRIVRGKRKL